MKTTVVVNGIKSKREDRVVPLKDLVGSEYNPSTRTNEKILAPLREELRVNGQLSAVTAVEQEDKSLVLADGHRRVEGLADLGVTDVKTTVYSCAAEDRQALQDALFVALNKATRAFNGRDKLNVALQGGPVFDNNTRSAKTYLEDLFQDVVDRDFLIQSEITTTVLSLAKKSAKYVLPDVGLDTPTFRNRMRTHIQYLLRNDAQQALIAYMRREYDKTKLKTAIDNNRPVPLTTTPRGIENWKTVAPKKAKKIALAA